MFYLLACGFIGHVSFAYVDFNFMSNSKSKVHYFLFSPVKGCVCVCGGGGGGGGGGCNPRNFWWVCLAQFFKPLPCSRPKYPFLSPASRIHNHFETWCLESIPRSLYLH